MDTHILTDEELLAYADGRLDQIDSAVIASHVLICNECAATVAHYRGIRTLVRTDDSMAPSLVTLAKAQAIFSEYYRVPKRRWWSIDLSQLYAFNTRFSRSLLLGFFILIGVLFFGDTALVVTAAQDTLPADTLYPVKIASEKAQLAVSFDDTSRIESHLGSAHHRVNEIAGLATVGRTSDLVGTVSAYESVLRQVVTELAVLEKDNAQRVKVLEQRVDRALSQDAGILRAIDVTMLSDVKPLVERAIRFSESVQVIVQQALNAKPTVLTAPPNRPPQVDLWTRIVELFSGLR